MPLVMLTVTNNTGGGQPVSLANVKQVREVRTKHGVPLFFDACRFAENCYFIQQRESGQANRSTRRSRRSLFSQYGDGCTMSAKKDGPVNIGGFLAMKNEEGRRRSRTCSSSSRASLTYGGLAGRDLEAIARGLREVLSEDYLRSAPTGGAPRRPARPGRRAHREARRRPRGVHRREALPAEHPAVAVPGQALVVALYREYGIRAVEVGSPMFAQPDEKTGEMVVPEARVVRLAVPRRVHDRAHALRGGVRDRTVPRPRQTARPGVTYEAPCCASPRRARKNFAPEPAAR